ncbi:MAG: hypothetical protein KME04_20300 [Pleurocapsa minor GSE-CHR-MK-17-07R]|jgi:hypothetical protein|nr:hypothetical protein [Pleurocapsa minor GSE-CHR-MK 17-07R]
MPFGRKTYAPRLQRQSPAGISRRSSDSGETEDYLLQKALKEPTAQNLTPQVLGKIQRSLGNHAVTQLVSSAKKGSPVIQRNVIKDKLTAHINNQGASQKIQGMAAHLLAAMNAIDAKDWDEAYRLLYNKGVAAQFGISLSSSFIVVSETPGKSQEDIEQEVNTQMEKGMRFENKLILPDVAVAPPGANIMQFKNAQNTEWLAIKVFPVLLEEWIHEFQHTIGGLLSDSTVEFSQSPAVLANAQQGGERQWNMREADIYAIYKELGWATVLTDFKARYTERQKLDEFMIAKEIQHALNTQLGAGMASILTGATGRRGKNRT